MRIWDLRAHSRTPIQELSEAKDSVSSVFVTHREIITGSIDGNVRVYDVRAGRLSVDCVGHPVTSVRLSHDGNCILATSLDGVVRLLDKESGELLSQ